MNALTSGVTIAAAPASPPADALDAVSTSSMLEYVQSGGFLGYVLILLSIVGLALIVRNVMVLRASVLAPPDVVNDLSELLRAGDLPGVQQLVARPSERCFLTEILRQTIRRCTRSPMGALEFRSAMEEAGQVETERLHRLNDGLGIIAAVGPMIGLLGTVIGMIGAFRSISDLEGAARSSELARFMSLALVNTAEGLIVAVPCTVAFALFRRRIEGLVLHVGEVVEQLAAPLERALGARGAPPPGAAARAGTALDPVARAPRGRSAS
jgi:biopolymer transport protein ExbB